MAIGVGRSGGRPNLDTSEPSLYDPAGRLISERSGSSPGATGVRILHPESRSSHGTPLEKLLITD
jgi:hypothetical protein